MNEPTYAKKHIESALRLREQCGTIGFGGNVETVYNPLEYAWAPYEDYLRRFSASPKKTIFLGMNPGPWGMAQTGVPFGEIDAVKTWLKIEMPVGKPKEEIPQRPVTGFACTRSEVSGRRVWGLMRKRFGTPEEFFKDHFIANYCPLIFFDKNGKNLTPDKLIKEDREKLFALCDSHIRDIIEILRPAFLVGFGKFAEDRLTEITAGGGIHGVRVLRVLHPSPANPHANRGWEEQAVTSLSAAGVWSSNKIEGAEKKVVERCRKLVRREGTF
jgi:single-strand selective monofunctional uracil DNA glycosylase